MLRSVAVQRIQDGLGFRTDQADKIILRLQEEQRDLEQGKTLPSFLSDTATLAFAAGSTTGAPFPTDFIRVHHRRPFRYISDTDAWVYLPWKYIENVVAHNFTFGTPSVVVIDTPFRTFYVRPTADAAYELYVTYYKKAALLTSDVENVWLANAPELLIGGAGRRIAADMRNKTAFELFDAMWKQSRATWFNAAVLEEVDEVGDLVLGANS